MIEHGVDALPPSPDRLVSRHATLLGGVLLALGVCVSGFLVAGAEAWAAGGTLAIWTVLLVWSLWRWRDRLPSAWRWGLATAGGVSLLAQLLLLLADPTVFMQVNFVSLHVWALLCAAVLAVYACFAPRKEWLPLILSIGGVIVLAALMPFTPGPLVAGLVGGALGVVPALTMAGTLLRGPVMDAMAARHRLFRTALAAAADPAEAEPFAGTPAVRHRAGWSPAATGPRKLPGWPADERPNALISS